MSDDAPATTLSRSEAVTEAATRLTRASRTRTPCPPVSDVLGTTDVDLAYAVQDRWVADRTAAGATITGRKVGLTAPAVQRQLGVDQPDFGVLFDDMDVSGNEVAAGRLLQPKVEAEIAFGLARDLDDADLDLDAVAAAVAWLAPALEVVDSRIADWNITITDTIADNASSGLYAVGPRRAAAEGVVAREVTMTLHLDGRQVSDGDGSACLGDPFAAVLWCARTARDRGAPMRAGDVVLSGALGPMVPVAPGSHVVADFGALGRVELRFAVAEASR